MKKIICDHCGRPYEREREMAWGCLDKGLDILDAEGNEDEIHIDLCYLSMEKEIRKIHTRYATMLKRRKKA